MDSSSAPRRRGESGTAATYRLPPRPRRRLPGHRRVSTLRHNPELSPSKRTTAVSLGSMFISLEGIDGSGKTTQAKLLAAALGENVGLVREPGGPPAGERIRQILKDPELDLDPSSELLLFCAARAELVAEVVGPA